MAEWTPEKLQRAVAKWLGWTEIKTIRVLDIGIELWGKKPDGFPGATYPVPKFHSSVDVWNECVWPKILKESSPESDIAINLVAWMYQMGKLTNEAELAHAGACLRCRALVEALGLEVPE